MESLRKEIDKIDDEIISNLIKRFKVVKELKKYKKKVYDKEREEEIINRLSKKLDKEFVLKLYKVIFDYSKKLLRR